MRVFLQPRILIPLMLHLFLHSGYFSLLMFRVFLQPRILLPLVLHRHFYRNFCCWNIVWIHHAFEDVPWFHYSRSAPLCVSGALFRVRADEPCCASCAADVRFPFCSKGHLYMRAVCRIVIVALSPIIVKTSTNVDDSCML